MAVIILQLAIVSGSWMDMFETKAMFRRCYWLYEQYAAV